MGKQVLIRAAVVGMLSVVLPAGGHEDLFENA